MSSQEDSQPSQGSSMTVTDEDRHEVLYFAYGSNLSTEQMRHRCPYSTPIGLGYLKGWKWIINKRGYANIVQLPVEGLSPTSTREADHDGLGTGAAGALAEERGGVYGLLYLLPPQDEEKLDVYEGVPTAYQKFQVDMKYIRDGQGRTIDDPVKVLVYVDMYRVEEDLPREEYIGRLERGIKDAVENWGMSAAYADRVMRRYWRRQRL